MFARLADIPNARRAGHGLSELLWLSYQPVAIRSEGLVFDVYRFKNALQMRDRLIQLAEMMNRFSQIVSCLARYTPSITDQFDGGFMIEPTCILQARAVGGVGTCEHPWSVLSLGQGDWQLPRDVDLIDHFPRMDMGKNIRSCILPKAEGTPDAGAANIKAEHQAGITRRTAIDVGIDAKGTMIAAQECRLGFSELEFWPPHQRTIGEYPYSIFGRFSHHRQDIGCMRSLALAGT